MKDTGERLIPEGHTQTLTYGEHLARYLSVMPIIKNKIVLDIASGAGYGTKLISGDAKKVYGIDYSSEAVKYAKEYYGSKNIEYIKGDAQAIPLADNSVDVIVSFETIEHLKNPKKFIKEVKRILKNDGQFIVSTPNDDEFIEGNKFHLHEFQLNELKTLISSNFKHCIYYYQGSYFSSALLDEATFSKGGKWNGRVEKTFPQVTTSAAYYVAIASQVQVDHLSQTVTVADIWSTKEDLIRDSARRTETNQLRNEVKRWANEHRKLSAELLDIKTSKAWKLIEKIRKTKSRPRRS